MKAHNDAQKLIAWLRVNPPATVKQIASAGGLNARDASDAVHYGVRRGAIERVKGENANAGERALYRLTGKPLPVSEKISSPPSFDELLCAWGIARVAPRLPSTTSGKCAEENLTKENEEARDACHGRHQ